MVETVLMRRFNLSVPVIQAPMAGGGDTPALVAAVSEAGGIGFIGAAYLSPEQIASASQSVRAQSNRPFGINLFAPQPTPAMPAETGPARTRLAPYFEELGLPPPAVTAPTPDQFRQQFDAALDSGASAFSFTLGIPPADVVAAIKARGQFLMGTATNVSEAISLEQAGFDAVIGQGSEAGGHRGTFADTFDAGMIGTMALVPQMADAVSIPIIASGGIMDGRGIAAAMILGAAAVQLGTAFLTCDEAGVPNAYKDAILAARDQDTRITRAFSGRPARGIANRFMTEVDAGAAGDAREILPFPYQNGLTRPLRTEAAKQGCAEYLSLWAGQGVGLARRQSAVELVAGLAAELESVLARKH